MALYVRPASDLAPRRMPQPPLRAWVTIEDEPELAGLGKFFKKAAKAVTRVARAPIQVISPRLARNLEKIDHKIIDNVDALHTRINDEAKRTGRNVGRFVKRNLKWIIIAAAIAITIYSMGSGTGIAAKMMSGLTKLKTLAAAKFHGAAAWSTAKGTAAKAAMTKLIQGKRFGDLSSEEVSAMAEANDATGEQIVPPEVMALLQPTTETLPMSAEGEAAAPASEGASKALPVVLGGGALLALLALA